MKTVGEKKMLPHGFERHFNYLQCVGHLNIWNARGAIDLKKEKQTTIIFKNRIERQAEEVIDYTRHKTQDRYHTVMRPD